MEVRAMFRAIKGRQTPIQGSYLHLTSTPVPTKTMQLVLLER